MSLRATQVGGGNLRDMLYAADNQRRTSTRCAVGCGLWPGALVGGGLGAVIRLLPSQAHVQCSDGCSLIAASCAPAAPHRSVLLDAKVQAAHPRLRQMASALQSRGLRVRARARHEGRAGRCCAGTAAGQPSYLTLSASPLPPRVPPRTNATRPGAPCPRSCWGRATARPGARPASCPRPASTATSRCRWRGTRRDSTFWRTRCVCVAGRRGPGEVRGAGTTARQRRRQARSQRKRPTRRPAPGAQLRRSNCLPSCLPACLP